MRSFRHINARSVREAISFLIKYGPEAKLVAGGSDILPLMKERIMTPEFLINLKTIPELRYISEESQGLRMGALTTLREVETDAMIRQRFPLLARVAAEVASPQIRNVGTIGGNLCQRPWCWYFRGALFRCLRKGGNTCFAASGENKYHAIIDGGPCYIVHPSDMAIAFIALGAKIRLVSSSGERVIPLEEFFVGPKQNLLKENMLESDEIVTEIYIPKPQASLKSVYFKQRERRSWDHATVGLTAAIAFEEGICTHARIVLCGVAPVPFIATASEAILRGREVDESLCLEAAEAAMGSARPLDHNAYKVHLAKVLVRRAILATMGENPDRRKRWAINSMLKIRIN